MKKLKTAVLALACAAIVGVLALAGCSQGATNSQAEGELTKVKFTLDYTPNANHTGLYVAQAKGWFAEEGIEVEFLPVTEDGSDAVIGSGAADLGVTYQDFIANSLGSDNPLPYTAVAAVVQHNTSGIMSRAEDGITSPAAMAGHRYATWNMPVEQAIVKKIVEDDGASFDDVDLVPYEVDDDIMGLQADLYDCVWAYEGWAGANATIQDYPVNYFAFRDINPVFDYYTPVIAVNDDFAAANPEVVKAFLRAAKRGYEYAAEHPEEAAEILCEAVPELDPKLVAEAQNVMSPFYVADAEGWGVIDADRWTAFYQWINDEGLVENSFDPTSGYTMEYLQ